MAKAILNALQQFKDEEYAPFKEQVQKCDRRNFEAFLFAKVIHNVFLTIPFFRFYYRWKFGREFDKFLDSMGATPAKRPFTGGPPNPPKPPPGRKVGSLGGG